MHAFYFYVTHQRNPIVQQKGSRTLLTYQVFDPGHWKVIQDNTPQHGAAL